MTSSTKRWEKNPPENSQPSCIRSIRHHQHRMGQRLPRPAAAQAELAGTVEAQPGRRCHGEEAAPAGMAGPGMKNQWKSM